MEANHVRRWSFRVKWKDGAATESSYLSKCRSDVAAAAILDLRNFQYTQLLNKAR